MQLPCTCWLPAMQRTVCSRAPLCCQGPADDYQSCASCSAACPAQAGSAPAVQSAGRQELQQLTHCVCSPQGLIDAWCDFALGELNGPLLSWWAPLSGYTDYNKQVRLCSSGPDQARTAEAHACASAHAASGLDAVCHSAGTRSDDCTIPHCSGRLWVWTRLQVDVMIPSIPGT